MVFAPGTKADAGMVIGTIAFSAARSEMTVLAGVLTRLLSRYDVDSNREGGLGRYDILVAPRTRGEPGAVLEFKVARDARARTVGAALTEGLAQIKRKGYAAQLQQRGAAPIWCYAVACCGKQVFVRRQGERGSHPRPAA